MSCLARSLRRAYDGTIPGMRGRYPVSWREMGSKGTTSWMRGMAELAKAVMA